MKKIESLDELKKGDMVKSLLDSTEFNLIFGRKDTTRREPLYVFYGHAGEGNRFIEYHCFRNNVIISDGKIIQDNARYGEDFVYVEDSTQEILKYKKSLRGATQ